MRAGGRLLCAALALAATADPGAFVGGPGTVRSPPADETIGGGKHFGEAVEEARRVGGGFADRHYNLLFRGDQAAAGHPKWRIRQAQANRSLHFIHKESL